MCIMSTAEAQNEEECVEEGLAERTVQNVEPHPAFSEVTFDQHEDQSEEQEIEIDHEARQRLRLFYQSDFDDRKDHHEHGQGKLDHLCEEKYCLDAGILDGFQGLLLLGSRLRSGFLVHFEFKFKLNYN